MPRAPDISPEELVDLGEAYARRTGYPIQVQWTLLEGINDTDAELEGITRLLAGKYAVMNLIPYNSVEGGRGRDDAHPAPARHIGKLTEIFPVHAVLKYPVGEDEIRAVLQSLA